MHKMTSYILTTTISHSLWCRT